MFAELGTFPIDTTKTRLQIQGQMVEKSLTKLKYRGMCHAIYKISREEGIMALYNGIKPALLRQGTHGTLTIGVYHGIKRLLCEDIKDETLVKNMFSGVVAGALSSGVCNPTDVLKVRLQAQTLESTKNGGMVRAFVNIYKLEGLKGLYRGVGPCAQRASVSAGVHLPTYDFSKRCIIDSEVLNGDNIITYFVASFLSGLAASLASNPLDVIKTRMMNQQNISGSSSQLYKNSLDCLIRTCKQEGPMALYKGFVPTFCRLGPWSILFFLSYEQLKHVGELINFLPKTPG